MGNKIRAAPRNSARSLRQDFCPNSKFGKRRNTVCISACQKSLAEFAARRRQRDSDHFLSGRTPGWSLLPLRGNSPPVPDRKYLSGCKSSAAALCRAQPPKAALGAELCVLSAYSGQDVRAADCNPFVKKGQSPFLTGSNRCGCSVHTGFLEYQFAAIRSQGVRMPRRRSSGLPLAVRRTRRTRFPSSSFCSNRSMTSSA